MKPEYIENYTKDIFNVLLDDLVWSIAGSAYYDYFMSEPAVITLHPLVKELMQRMNKDFRCDYDICSIIYYSGNENFLGWHTDNGPEMDQEHPIAVVSYRAPRFIYWKNKGYEVIHKQLLGNGSLFIMPKGFQKDHLHKIPKHNCECKGRISLTFRNLKG